MKVLDWTLFILVFQNVGVGKFRPNLLLMGMLAGAAARLSGSILVRRIAGVTVMLFGIYTLWQAF